jgi:hypothetical protein
MADLDAAIGFVVAHGDRVDRARLSYLRSGTVPPADVLDAVEVGQAFDGGFPALWTSDVGSVDATCFRLAELDDVGALNRPAGRRALAWLASRQRADGSWEEDKALADVAPSWARPGDPEARLYLTANAAFWLAVGGPDTEDEKAGPGRHSYGPTEEDNEHAERLALAGAVIRDSLAPDGSWPSYLATGWLGASLLFRLGWFYEAARIQVILGERVPEMSAADTASLACALRRIGVAEDDWLLVAARRRLAETQRSDGGWESDDGRAFDVHTTLAAIRALR